MDIDSADTVTAIVHAATAQFDIIDVKIKPLDFPRIARKIIRILSG
jgi:hypothetical protein